MNAATTPALRIRVAPVVQAPVVMLAGEVDLSTVAGLVAALEHLDGRVVVDLQELAFLDCVGIGTFVAFRNRLRADGGALHFRSPQPVVRRVLELLGFADWVVDGTPRANSSFSGHRVPSGATERPQNVSRPGEAAAVG